MLLTQKQNYMYTLLRLNFFLNQLYYITFFKFLKIIKVKNEENR